MPTRTATDDVREVTNLSGFQLVEATEHGLPTQSIAQLRELGLTFRPVAETLRDEIAWFRAAGILPPSGEAAAAHVAA